ncbi:8092_t:CDS:2, partial [Racocetra fulgida]
TGSFLLTCAHFGAFTLGSDIDGRQIRGQDQYNLSDKVLDSLVFDIRHHPWRENLWFDAIVTDRERLVTMEKFKENVEGEHANVKNAKSLDNMSLLFQKKKEGKSDRDEKDFGKTYD